MAANNLPPPPASAPYDDFRSPQWQAWFRQVRDYSMAFSIGLTMPANTFTVSNSPLTHNGTIGVTYNSQSSNLFLASPTSGAGIPTWRAISSADFKNTVITTTTNYTVLDSDYYIRCNNTVPITITIPTAVGRSGKEFEIKTLKDIAVTISGATIDGQTSQIITSKYVGLKIVSNGTTWDIV